MGPLFPSQTKSLLKSLLLADQIISSLELLGLLLGQLHHLRRQALGSQFIGMVLVHLLTVGPFELLCRSRFRHTNQLEGISQLIFGWRLTESPTLLLVLLVEATLLETERCFLHM